LRIGLGERKAFRKNCFPFFSSESYSFLLSIFRVVNEFNKLVGELRKEKTQLLSDLQRAETFSGIVFTEIEDDDSDAEDIRGVEPVTEVAPHKSFIKQHPGSLTRRTSCDDCNVLENTGSLRSAADAAISKVKGGTIAFSDDSCIPFGVSVGKQEEKKLLHRHTSHSHGLKLVSFERADSLLKNLENSSKPPVVKQATDVSPSSVAPYPFSSLDTVDGKALIPRRPSAPAPSDVNGARSYLRTTVSSRRFFGILD
jgi:hypothetical protein